MAFHIVVKEVHGEVSQNYAADEWIRNMDIGLQSYIDGTINTYIGDANLNISMGNIEDPDDDHAVEEGSISSSSTSEDGVSEEQYSLAYQLSNIISSWYYRLLVIAAVGMLSVLVYIGIRILISSTAPDKAKYKQLLGDWLFGMVLLFTMHYIMVFANTFADQLTSFLASAGRGSYNIWVADKDDKIQESLEEYGFTLEVVTSTDDGNPEDASTILVYEDEDSGEDYVLWNTNLMGKLRIDLQAYTDSAWDYIGYTIMYIMMVIYLCMFVVVYMKRVVYMAFLTLIAPLVALTYPIDKANDGSAQGFNYWFKEYMFNLLLQPLHLLLYTILVSSAMELALKNVLYAVVALGFMVPAEKILRKMFNFQKADTPGVFGGVVGATAVMSGMRWLTGHGPRGGHGPGGGQGDEKQKRDENGRLIASTGENKVNLSNVGESTAIGDGGQDSGDTQTDSSSEGQNSGATQTDSSGAGSRGRSNSAARETGTGVGTDTQVGDENRESDFWLNDRYQEIFDDDSSDNETTDTEALDVSTDLSEFPLLDVQQDQQNQQEQQDQQAQQSQTRIGTASRYNGRTTRNNGYQGRRIQQPQINEPSARNNGSNSPETENSNNERDNNESSRRNRSLRRALASSASLYRSGMGQKLTRNLQNAQPAKKMAKIALGAAGGAALGMVGLAAGATTGDPTKALQYGGVGAAGGYKLGSNTSDAVINGTTSALSVDGMQEEARRGYLGEEEYQKEIARRNQELAMKNNENIRRVQEKFKCSRTEAEERLQGMIPFYYDNKVTDVGEMLKMEKAVDKLKERGETETAAREHAYIGWHTNNRYSLGRPTTDREVVKKRIVKDNEAKQISERQAIRMMELGDIFRQANEGM